MKKYKFIFTLIFYNNAQTLNLLNNINGYFLFTTDIPIIINNQKPQVCCGTLYKNDTQQITLLIETFYPFKIFTPGVQIEIDSLTHLPNLSIAVIMNKHILNMYLQILFRGNKISVSIIHKINKHKIGIEFYFDPSFFFYINSQIQNNDSKKSSYSKLTSTQTNNHHLNPTKTQINKTSTLTTTNNPINMSQYYQTPSNKKENISINQLETTLSLVSYQASITATGQIQKIVEQFDLIAETIIVHLKNNKKKMATQAPLLLIIIDAGKEKQLIPYLTNSAAIMLKNKRTWTTFDSKGILYNMIETCSSLGAFASKLLLNKESIQLAKNIANFSKTGNILIIEGEDSLEQATTQHILNETTYFINSLKKISEQLPIQNDNILQNIQNIENHINDIIGNNKQNILNNLINLRYAQLPENQPNNCDCRETLKKFQQNTNNALKNIINELNKIPNLSNQIKDLIKSTLTIDFNSLKNQQLPNVIYTNPNIDIHFKAKLYEYIININQNILNNTKQKTLYNILFSEYNEKLKKGLHINQNNCKEQHLIEELKTFQEYIYVNPINQLFLESLDTINYKFSTYTMKILSNTNKPITKLFIQNLLPKLENLKKIIIEFFEELNNFLNPNCENNLYIQKLIDLDCKDILFLHFIQDIKTTNNFFENIANLLNIFDPLLKNLKQSLTIKKPDINFKQIFANLIISLDNILYTYYNNSNYNKLIKTYAIAIHQGINQSNIKRNIKLENYKNYKTQYLKNDEYDENYKTIYINDQEKYADYMQYRKIINQLISFKEFKQNANDTQLKILDPKLLTVIK